MRLRTRRNRETLWRSRLLLLALQFLQELFWSLDHRLTIWLLLLLVSLSGLVGCLILQHCVVVSELISLFGFLPRRDDARWHPLRLARNRLLPSIPLRRRRGFRRAAGFVSQDYAIDAVWIRGGTEHHVIEM